MIHFLCNIEASCGFANLASVRWLIKVRYQCNGCGIILEYHIQVKTNKLSPVINAPVCHARVQGSCPNKTDLFPFLFFKGFLSQFVVIIIIIIINTF